MSEDFNSLVYELSNLKRQMAGMFHVGTVAEVKGDKIRMVIAKGANGEDVLGPWVHTAQMRGGATEARFYKKGQTVTMMCPGGNLALGMVLPYAPNTDFKRPDHANEDAQDEETYQQGDLRQRKTSEAWETWTGDAKSTVKNGKGFSGNSGDNRVTAHSKGSTIATEADGFVSVKDKRVYVSKPPRIRPTNPIPKI